MSLAGGTRLGHYEVVAPIGAGGMGEVYRAHDERLRRDVAIKVLPSAVRDDPQRLKRFEHEARAAGSLNHPGILSVFDVGEYDGSPYLVTELLEGATLRERLRGGPLPVRKAIEYAVLIAQALAAAHAAGVVHRDLKPENLFVTKDGRAKILDFGLAKALEESAARDATLTADRTDSGGVLGTAGYMAPEQVRGKAVDHRADLFAFGVVLHEMLSGTAPFAKDTPIDRALATLNDDPPPLAEKRPEVTPALDAIVRRCLEKSQEERFQSARDLAFALKALATTSSSGVGTLKAQPEPSPRRGTLVLAIAGVVVFGVSGYMLGHRLAPRAAVVAPPAPPPAPAAGLTFERVTFRNGDITRARFAPDGKTIIFGARFDGDDLPHVYSAIPGAVEPRALYDRPMDLVDVAPNGELALALKGATFALARAPLGGGEPRVLLDSFGRHRRDYEDASWDRNGDSLVQMRAVDGRFRLEESTGTTLFETREGIVEPHVSPDGTLVAFTRSERPSYRGSRIEVADRAGHRKVLFDAKDPIDSIAWHPGGKEIWFTIRHHLAAVTLDGVERPITDLPGMMTIEALAPDGRALLVRHDHAVHLVGHRNGADTELTWLNASSVSEISEDGKLVLFGEYGMDKPHVYVRPLDARPAVRIGDGAAWDLSADGAWALIHPIVSNADSVKDEVLVVPTGAGQSRSLNLRPLGELDSACFFHDGTRILMSGNEGGKPNHLWIADIASGAPARAFGPELIDIALEKPSPDGKYIVAYTKDNKPALIALDGGEPVPIVGLDADRPIAWGSDSRSLYVVHRDENDDVSVYHLDLRTHVRTLKLKLDRVSAKNNDRIEHVVMTPDGSAYAYDYVHRSGQLYLVTGLR